MTPIPEQLALEHLAALPPGARVVVDFDETLLLANSTLLFLDSVRPRWLAWVVFKLVALVFRLLPKGWQPWRDAATLVAVSVACPWARAAWRRQAPQVASAHANLPLARALVAHCPPSQVVVCSFGLGFVIRPLLAPLWQLAGAPAAWHAVPLVASTARSAGADRRVGKPTLLARQGLVAPGEPLAVVTDSLDDRDLLAQATHPLYVKWAATHTVPLFGGLYLPLRYAQKLRHPRENFVPRVLMFEEWVGLLLVFGPALWAAPVPAGAALGVLLLVFSFWCVYEQGYAENDRVAVQREGKQPTPDEQARFAGAHRSGEPWGWAWALALAAAAVPLLPTALPPLAAWGGWVAALLGMRLTYAVYNHLQPAPRVWLYPVLQGWKLLPLAALLPLNAVGLAFVVAYTVSRWFPYWIYRAGGQRKGFPELALRAVLLLAGLALWLGSGGWASATAVVWAQAGLVAAYMLLRARHELRHALRAFAWLPRAPSPSAPQDPPHA